MLDNKAVVSVSAETSGIDLAIKKVKQLKLLLQEVKDLAASLDLKISVNEQPITSARPEDV